MKEVELRQQRRSRLLAILYYIQGFNEEYGMPPTLAEIGATFELSKSAVFAAVKKLAAAELVKRKPKSARTLLLTEAGKRAIARGQMPSI